MSQRGLPSHIRHSSAFGGQAPATSQSFHMQNRIAEKKVELENLRQLRDLSAGLAGQMQQLEEKLSVLSDGTEAVAAVLGNWNSVLRSIHMASATIPKSGDEAAAGPSLPQTLVRIPIQQAERAQRDAEVVEAAAVEE